MDKFVIRQKISPGNSSRLPKLDLSNYTATSCLAKKSKLPIFSYDENQLILDAGQKQFGPQRCETCHMVYDPTFGPDAKAHSFYHKRSVNVS